jgi:hypothetical protein
MHYLCPNKETAHVLVFYRNFLARGGSCFCHIGLGVNALHTCRVLRKHKVRADPFGVWLPKDIADQLAKTPTATHAIIEAPWVAAGNMANLMQAHPHVHFICRNHSQIGFLQVEAGAIKMIRDYFHLQDGALNFTFSANNARFCDYAEKAYRGRCEYLPNLYDLSRVDRKPPHCHQHGAPLRISSFGSLRLLKNHTTAVAAAQLIARSRNSGLDFYVSTNREEHGRGVLQAIRNMLVGLPGVRLIENGWQSWSEFRHTVAHMDLCLQPSFTETFNIVSADACAEGVPVVGSDAIEWLPRHWQADVDSAEDIARVGNALLSDRFAAAEGMRSLERYMHHSVATWLRYLGSGL